MQPFGLQEWIHKIEEGEGTRYLKIAVLLLGLMALAVLYHWREAKNFTLPEAMDAAQVARNISEGKGFSTKFIRPISVAMVAQVKGETTAFLKENFPDLEQPPVYPAILGGLMKVLPFDWKMPEQNFKRYQPEVLIGIFNQVLFFIAFWLVKKIGHRLFDNTVGWIAAIIFAGTELFWQFTTSGLSTMLLVVLFLALAWMIVRVEEEISPLPPEEASGEAPPEPQPATIQKSNSWFLMMSVLMGLTIGAMALTRYSLAWVTVPVAAFLLIYGGTRRLMLVAPAVLVVLACLGPWVFRNYQASQTLFGTAGLAIHKETGPFPGNLLDRSMPRDLTLELNRVELQEYPRKLAVNLLEIFKTDLPQIGGNWIVGLFLASLLVPFRKAALSRLRWFLLGVLATLMIAQALIRTEAGAEAMPVSPENLLVLAAPIIFIYGVGMFFVLLDQIQFVYPQWRSAVIGGLVLICWTPFILTLLPPKSSAIAYPPYYPPVIQTVGGWMEEEELIMSDMPWAVAWYGNRQSIWTTLDWGNSDGSDYYRINDYQKPIKALYLTPITTNSRFLMEMLKSPEGAWGRFILESVLRTNVPAGYPLRKAPSGFFPDQLFLSDRVRWSQTK